MQRARQVSIFIIIIGSVATLLLGAGPCWSTVTQTAAAPITQNAAARIVTDEVGRQVTLPANVKRIVSLAPNLTEMVYDFGLGDRIAGDTDFCDTPPEAKLKPHVGAPINPSLEAIVALHPDLVLATTSINRRETVDALARLGIAVYTSDPHTVRAMLDSFQRMAELMGAETHGTELVSQLRARLNALQTRLADRPLVHVLFVVWENPLISIGQNTFIADALRWAGAESVVISKRNWPTLSFEEVVRLQPEYLVFASEHTGASPVELERLRAEPAWKDLEAVQTGHVVIVSNAVTRPSPGLIDVIEQLAHDLHPEVFTASREERQAPVIAARETLAAIPALRHAQECTSCAL